MNNGLNTITYLINQLVDVRVACQFWIDKDEETQDHIKKLEAKLKTSETESLQKDALIYDYRKHTKDLEEQLGHSYDSGLEAVEPYLPDENVDEISKEIQSDLAQEFDYMSSMSDFSADDPEYFDDPRDYPEEQSE